MLAKRLMAVGIAALSLSMFGVAPCFSATPASDNKEGAKEPTIDEIKAKRQSVREDLMIPSLEGIRGLTYFVVSPSDTEDYEKVVAEKLSELKIPVTSMRSLNSGTKPVDAIVQIKVLKPGAKEKVSLVTLSVTQWCTLLRNKKISCKAITYHESIAARDTHLKDAISEVSSHFVISFLKANKKL